MPTEHTHHRFADGTGKTAAWRSLAELSATPEFEEYLHREFPHAASEWNDGVSRRRFLQLMGASLALAGLNGCVKQPEEKIVPYVQAPEQIVPGKPLYYASAFNFDGFAQGILVETHMGRPVKIEGNPDHPYSLGATSAFAQASVLDLWDPDRARSVTRAGQVSTWSAFLTILEPLRARWEQTRGAGLHILTETSTSPTLAAQLRRLLEKYPQARWHRHDPVGRDNGREGARLAFGRPAQAVYHFDKARRILSLDSDFLFDEPGSVRYARQFIDNRRAWADTDQSGEAMFRPPASADAASRLYMAQSTPTITGAMADHRLVLRASQVEQFARGVARALGLGGEPTPWDAWINACVTDLKSAGANALVIAGRYQPPAVHALAHAINAALGVVGTTATYTEPLEYADGSRTLAELADDLRGGRVETLLVLGGNPVYTAPADTPFEEALKAFVKTPGKLLIANGLHFDETAYYSHWHIPRSHDLEAWSDLRATDGTVSIIQPTIAPLYESKSAHEILDALLGEMNPGGPDAVRRHWRQIWGEKDFDARFNEALRVGIVKDSAAAAIDVRAGALPPPVTVESRGLEIIFRPDPTVWDGRWANNGWLQELPKPLTKLVWDNAALLSVATARSLGLCDEKRPEEANGKLLQLELNGRRQLMPAWVTPHHPDGTVTVFLGFGRQRVGKTGNNVGHDAYRLRDSKNPWIAQGLSVTAAGGRYPLACTQGHFLIESGDLAQSTTLAAALNPAPPEHHGKKHVPLSLYPQWDYSKGHAWAMQIDTSACIGCNACVLACQAENNVPVVGKEQVLNGREMHWLRIDTYYKGPAPLPAETVFQPIPCMHCENAPCEVVCPVAATSHSAEGINEMTYNRCVGTRYCSNNCPYKVRRFNFLHYSRAEVQQNMLRANPDVTVRERGVMEKCTYCIQRINGARIELKKLDVQAGGHLPADVKAKMDAIMGELQTACQQACPTEAIVFGDRNWRDAQGRRSAVARLQDANQPQDYGLLTELNTQPRTRYLRRLFNPNPNMPQEAAV